MSNSNTSAASGGLGIFSVLTIIFVVLKLVGVAPVATWSWLWVLSPLWIGFGLSVALIVFFLLLAGIVAFFNR